MANAMQVSEPRVSNGSQRNALNFKKPIGARTGDVVSDDSDGDDEADSSANEDDEDDEDDTEEPDAFALSGSVPVCQAGRVSKSIDMLDRRNAQAVAGADLEGSNESDEDGYGAIEEISDSEENNEDVDEKDVLRSAEKELIAEFESTEKPRVANAVTNELSRMSVVEEASLARRLSLQSENSMDDGDDFGDLDFTQDPFGGLPSNHEHYQDLIEDAEGYFDNELASWRIPDASRESLTTSTNQKKVRFEERTFSRSRTSSLSSEEEDPRDSFPDLLDGSSGDQMSRSQILLGQMDDYAMQVDNESVYDFDFEDPYEKAAFEIDGQSDSDSESTDDSDDGDTTDEETADEHIARVKAIQQARIETRANTPSTGPSTPVPAAATSAKGSRTSATARKTGSKSDRRPKSGTFIHDPAMASVSADVKGAGVKLVCPTHPPESERAYWERARRAMGSRDGSPGASVSWTRSTPRTAAPPRVLTAKSTLGTMFDGNLDFLRNNDECGITKELITPAANVNPRSSFASSTATDEDLTDAESTINLDDFVQMSDSDMDVDDDEALSRPSTSAGFMSSGQDSSQDLFSAFTCESSPMPRGDGADLLDHFDQQPGLVSSFRNNQHFARAASSMAANPAKRAQTSEANALQKGRRGAANTPITPARKSRANSDLSFPNAGVKKNVSSPLAQKHRRSRNNSLSQTLAQGTFTSTGHSRQ